MRTDSDYSQDMYDLFVQNHELSVESYEEKSTIR